MFTRAPATRTSFRDRLQQLNFDPGSLVVSLLVSALGFVLFSYGRKMQRIPQITAGLVLMVFPYFTSGILGMLLIAVGIVAALGVALWQGL